MKLEKRVNISTLISDISFGVELSLTLENLYFILSSLIPLVIWHLRAKLAFNCVFTSSFCLVGLNYHVTQVTKLKKKNARTKKDEEEDHGTKLKKKKGQKAKSESKHR